MSDKDWTCPYCGSPRVTEFKELESTISEVKCLACGITTHRFSNRPVIYWKDKNGNPGFTTFNKPTSRYLAGENILQKITTDLEKGGKTIVTFR